MALDTWERLTEWATFDGWENHRETPIVLAALYEVIGDGGKQHRVLNFYSYLGKNYNGEPPPEGDEELTLRVPIFAGGVRRISEGADEVTLGEGRFYRPQTKGRIGYETSCGQHYEMLLADMLALAEWAEA